MTQPDFTASGHSTVSVYMMADGARRVIDVIGTIFGGTVLMKREREDGSIVHASVRKRRRRPARRI